jgi:hypothetical protein
MQSKHRNLDFLNLSLKVPQEHFGQAVMVQKMQCQGAQGRQRASQQEGMGLEVGLEIDWREYSKVNLDK